MFCMQSITLVLLATSTNLNSGHLRNGSIAKIEGILLMKKKYKEEGMSFKCFHNQGHPERWSPRRFYPDNYTALERVAVLSDEIAERVGTFVKEPHAVPYIPGRKRWTVSYKGEDCQTAETSNEDADQNTTQRNLLRGNSWRQSRGGSRRSSMGCDSKLQAIQQGLCRI